MEKGFLTAKIAVASAKFHIDKPYDYSVPDELADKVKRGLRVTVPFGRANKTSEAVILDLITEDQPRILKPIESLLEDEPAITEEQLKLALWMSDIFFCTLYDAIHACLPAGLWYRPGQNPTGARVIRYAALAVSKEAAIEQAFRRPNAPTQAKVLRALAKTNSEMTQGDITYQTGATSGVLKALENQGLITIIEREIKRRPKISPGDHLTPIGDLSPDQEAAYKKLVTYMTSPEPEAALLYGVTGSGKTAVYIKLIREALKLGKTAIMLVPEIALTPQLLSRFYIEFGDDVGVMHSALTPGERHDEWKRIRSGEVRIVVGTRSAVFAPLENLGLIILDEEQEYSYKSESSPRYHARVVAKWRIARACGLMLLGSATPSIESMEKASSGVYKLIKLPSRFADKPLPKVIIADMKEELHSGNTGPIGLILENELRANIERGEQSIIYLNRRGASPVVTCMECGHTYKCPHCSVHLTYHSANERLMCHYCGYSTEIERDCPECGGRLRYSGIGTQKAEEWLSTNFPNTGVLRMDADTVTASNSHDKILTEFREKRVPILLGTQMVAKGLDFGNVTLVGVISADMSLYVNDYRAFERTFSLLTQVVGRSGRGDNPGRAVIQTMTPQHSVILLAKNQDYDEFYKREIARRDAAGMPPKRDLISVTVFGEEEHRVISFCAKVRDTLKEKLAGTAQVMGPAPSVVPKISDKFRYKISILGKCDKQTRTVIAGVVRAFCRDPRTKNLGCFADYDPYE